jgi:hypothetical protein
MAALSHSLHAKIILLKETKMNQRILLIIWAVLTLPAAKIILAANSSAGESSFVPASHSLSRYESIWIRSPFITETPPTPHAPLSSKYRLVGFVSAGHESIAFLQTDNDPAQNAFMISVGHPDHARGLSLLSVSFDPDIHEYAAKIRQGSEDAILLWSKPHGMAERLSP